MKLTSRQDIEAPVAFVFDVMKDFSTWERAALRRGAEVARTDKLTEIGAGLSWMIKFSYRGKQRRLALQLTHMEQPTNLAFLGTGSSFDCQAEVDLLALAARRTRLSVTLDVRPRSIGARLVLQSLRLVKSRINRRYADRVAQVCAEIETRYRRSDRS